MKYPIIQCEKCQGSGWFKYSQKFWTENISEEYCDECLGEGEIDLEFNFRKEVENLALKITFVEFQEFEEQLKSSSHLTSHDSISYYRSMFQKRKQEIIEELCDLRSSDEGWGKLYFLMDWSEQIFLNDFSAPISSSTILPAEMQVYDDWIFDELPF